MTASPVARSVRAARRTAAAGATLALLCSGALVAAVAPAGAAGWVAPSATDSIPVDHVQLGTASVVMSPDGSATAVWLDSTALTPDGGFAIRYATRSAGGPWSEGPAALASDPRDTADAPQVAVDKDGRVTVAWVQHRITGGDDVFVSDRPASGSWTEARTVSDSAKDAKQVQVATNDSSTVTVGWTSTWVDDSDVDHSQIQAAQRLTGQAWGPVQDVSQSDIGATNPHLAGGSNKFVMGWTEKGATDKVVSSQQIEGFIKWSQWTDHTDAADGDSDASDVAMDGTGDAAVLWQSTKSGVDQVFAQVNPLNADWGDVRQLSGAGQDAGSGVLAVNPGGKFLASWSRTDGTYRRVQASWFNADTDSWTSAAGTGLDVKVATADGNADPVDAVVDDAGLPTLLVGTETGSSQSFRDDDLNGVWGKIVNFQPAIPVSVSRDTDGDVSAVSQQADGTLVERIFDNSGPVATTKAPTSVVTTATTVRPSWSATDTWSPIASYQLQRSSAPWNGGFSSYANYGASTTDTTKSYGTGSGRTYCYRVVATDTAGNVGVPSAQRCTTTPVDERSMKRSTHTEWRKKHGKKLRVTVRDWASGSSSLAYKKTYTSASRKGSALSIGGVRAKSLQVRVLGGRGQGSVSLYFAATRLGTWSLSRSRTQVLTLSKTLSTERTGTVTLKVASSGKPVRVDAVSAVKTAVPAP